jgi:hypothetical protein
MPDGHDTELAVGLRAAQNALNNIDARIKHVVLYTDGWGEGEDPVAVTQEMHAQGITVSAITEGPGSAPLLKDVAAQGGGRYFAVANMEEALQILVDETRFVSRNFQVEHPFTPRYGTASPILSGLENGLPQLYGYNGTTPKQTATIALADADGAPVLAQWQYGLGRAVAWTSDAKAQWAKDWVGWSEFPRFAAQLVGWVLPTVSNGGLNVDVHAEGGQTRIEVTAPEWASQQAPDIRATLVDADGRQRVVPLEAQAPGVYRGLIASPPQGTYMIQVAATQGGQVVAQQLAPLVVPYSPEYRLGQSAPALLVALAQTTGGSALSEPSEAFQRASQGATRAQDIARPLLLLALILLPIDIVVRRLMVLWRTQSRAQPTTKRRAIH